MWNRWKGAGKAGDKAVSWYRTEAGDHRRTWIAEVQGSMGRCGEFLEAEPVGEVGWVAMEGLFLTEGIMSSSLDRLNIKSFQNVQQGCLVSSTGRKWSLE